MASGKKNYFRHSTSAFEDEKIQKCIQLLGYEGYAFYFILVELLAKQCENSFKNPITLHQQSIRIVWRKQQQSCEKVIRKLEESGLFVATFRESFIDFDIPNLEKYMGFYTNKNDPNASKESKRKEKKIKESKEKITPPKKAAASTTDEVDVLNYLNTVSGKSYKPIERNFKFIRSVLKNFTVDEARAVVDLKQSQWAHSEEMAKYIRPETIFGSKFESYLQETNSNTPKTIGELFRSMGFKGQEL